MALSRPSILALLVLGIAVSGVALATGAIEVTPPTSDTDPAADGPLDTFDDRAEYVSYLERSVGSTVYAGRTIEGRADVSVASEATADAGGDASGSAPRTTPMATEAPTTPVEESEQDGGDRRVAGTNVQEDGIDEPDILKTDGRYFFYAPQGRTPDVRPVEGPIDRTVTPARPGVDRDRRSDRPPERPTPRTHVIDTTEPADPALVERIDASGRMLRTGDELVVLASDALIGYDVSDPQNPTRTWQRPLDSALVSARAQNGQLYLVTRERADPSEPCPLEPVGPDAPVPCTSIHHPEEGIDADVTYTALSIDPGSGDVGDATSFVGTRENSVVYMSQESLYVTYTTRTARMELATDYLLNESVVVPSHVKDRIRAIRSYDLSPRAERIEISSTVENWLASLPEGEGRSVRRSLSEGMDRYTRQRQRELTETGIVRIAIGDGDLTVQAVGEVPGEPLDQFSMDAHDGTLRIATTVPGAGDARSKNDLYTVDAETMETRGSVQDMSPGQRIYSVRYVGDTAYLVTFRQVDPFHVVDLSNPSNPVERGQVRLPGFSEYLHPVGDGMILGVGEENGQAKLTLFDATDPTNPRVVDSQLLDAHWSAVSETHHAFMQDARHEVVFVPAGERGAVVNYANDTLSLERSVGLDGPAQRARYVNDYLYVFSPGELAVLDETTWDRETSLSLPR